MKKILAAALACIMLLSFSLTAFAKTWDDVFTEAQLADAFADDDEAGVVVNLSGSIGLYNDLVALEGQNYEINGKEYFLADVILHGGGEGGSVTINADIKSTDSAALSVYEDVNVTVNGDVEGLTACNNAVVEITGNVNGLSGDPEEEEGVMTKPDGYSDGSAAIAACDQAQVTVHGDAVGGDSYGTYGWAGEGIYAEDSASITVDGDVTGGNAIADPNVAVNEFTYSRGGSGVYMHSTANVTVGGSVTGGSSNGDCGVGGYGADIILIFKEAGRRDEPIPQASGEYYETDIPLAPGSLTVNDIIRGGKDADGTDSAAIFFEDGAVVLDGEAPALEDLLAMNPADAIDALYEINYNNGYSESMYLKPLADALGFESVNEMRLTNYGDAMAVFAELPEETRKDTIEKMYEIATGLATPDLSEEYYIPQITTWKVEVGEKHEDTYDSDLNSSAAVLLAEDTLYTIRIDKPENGTLSTDVDKANAGDTVTVLPAPAEGYETDKVLLNGQEIIPVDGVYSFEIPENGGVILSATFKEKEQPPEDPPEIPKTGDSNSMALWFCSMIICCAGIVFVTLSGKKKGYNK